jgi:hypothetical protein
VEIGKKNKYKSQLPTVLLTEGQIMYRVASVYCTVNVERRFLFTHAVAL